MGFKRPGALGLQVPKAIQNVLLRPLQAGSKFTARLGVLGFQGGS